MTAKNLTTQSAAPEAPADVAPSARAAAPSSAPMETITLANHLNIEGRSYLPGAKVRVPADYARRLRISGYVART
ncbi:hypothetical protein OG217_05835 [Streptomyces sp. NBC_01023]|uniref:hypothetical protein n=1 Tax=Streptomyces sp. NBC_01023 TaxID=2903724 RepID=UPI003869C418|nr:hypothetical protein OG217_05835 [Streptomyces sp. NBC_01023]